MIQLILHLVGDYLTQSDWMAQNKAKSWWAATCHAVLYSVPFLLLGSCEAVWCIFITHYLIDRYRLARYVVWAKNFLAPRWVRRVGTERIGDVYRLYSVESRNYPWSQCSETGYDKNAPAWLTVWLMIVADNTLHLAINCAALRWL